MGKIMSKFTPLEDTCSRYLLNPNYVVSHHKDFDRQARKSAMASSQYTVHPVFSSMFSDLTKYRRLQVVCHPNARLPKHVDICYPRQETVGNISTSQNIEGKNRALFFSAPKIHQPSPAKYEQVRETISIPPGSICVGEERVQNKGIQTLYRESSAQTEPYQPDYYISKKCKDAPPEILAIDNIHSSHEGNILSVQRQRVRRAWLQRAMDFKVLTQLDQYEYKFREKELERMLVMQEEKAGLQILTTVDRQRLSTLWAVGSQRLQKKITQIKHNKERELRKIEAKCVKMNGKRSERSSSSYVKKPIKLAVNLNYLPNIDDFTHQTIDLDPRLKNKFGVCDKFMKKRERHMVEIKKELKKILEPEEEVIEDAMSWEAEDDMPVEVEEVFIPEVEKVDKSVATDFLLFLLDTQCKSVKLENLKEHFAQVKKKVMKYILDSLSKELDHVLEERMLKEMSERTADEDTNQDTGMVKEIIVSNKTSKEQLEMFQEVGQIAQEISSGILNEMFEEVSQKISAEKSKTKSESQSEMYVNQDKISSEDTCESLLADIIMDMILPLVVEEIERRRGSTQGDESIKKDSTGSFSAGSFMESLLAEVLDIAHPAEQQQSNAVVDGEECTELNVSQVMPEVLRIVERTGSDILNEIFSEMARRISSREFRLKHGLDEEQKSVLSNKSEESFIKEIIMHELLPEVIQELRRRKKMSNESSIGLGETIDDNIGHMIQVVGVVQTVASDILNNMIQKTTQATFSRIERKQSSTSTKIKGGFITDIIMDTLMPGVVEEVRRRNRVKCGYIDEDAHISEVVQVIQEAASDVLNVMFMAQPADGTDACTCSEEPIESYIWNLIVTTLPKHIRAEMDPRYYFDFNQDTTESFVWNLIVEALPKQIRDELMSSRDITQMTKVVGLIQKAASQMFTHMFTQVSRQIITGQSLTRTHSNDSFFAEIIMGAIMPEVMKEIERRQRPSFTGTWYEAIQTTSVTTSDIHSQVSAIVEKVASGILDEMLSVAKCQQTFSTTQDSHWNLGTPSGNIGNGSEIQQDVEADELNNAQLQTDDPTGREEEPKVDNMSSNI